jgi:hypothetical protein
MEQRMMYEQMHLVELKKLIKAKGVKHYYIMPKQEIIDLLMMNEIPKHMQLEKMNIHQLRAEARRRGLRGFWTLPRDRLVQILYPEYASQTSAHEYQKNKSDTNEHDQPQQHDPENVGVQEI